MIEYITAGSVIALIIGIAGWFISHTKNHPSKCDIDNLKNNVQWADVCDERSKRIEEAIDNVDKKLDIEFKNLRELIRNKI